MRRLYLYGLAFVAIAVLLVLRGGSVGRTYSHPAVAVFTAQGEAASWFAQTKPFCNPVEVETRLRWNPPPKDMQGSAYSAACYALAGKVDQARQIILELEGDDRWRAAGVVFSVAHPVADAGDDASAGPMMEIVVEFWPNHYMALYHAGMARLGLGDREVARDYLERFLQYYDRNDGWRSSALAALEDIGAR